MLFEDFVFNFNWRGIVWGSWLAAVTPRPEPYMVTLLEECREKAPHNTWIVDLALKSLSGKNHETNELLSIAKEYKGYLSQLPYKKLPLRKWYPEEYIKQNETKRIKVLEIYKSEGTDATLEYLKTIPKSDFDLEYKEWLKLQRA
jgi:hypothetical protein